MEEIEKNELKIKKRAYKKWIIFIIIIIILLIISINSYLENKEFERKMSIIASSASDYVDGINTATSHLDEFSYNYATGTVDYTPKSNSTNNESSSISLGKQNALSTAKQYLNFSAFSYQGLLEQLEYEGYSNEESTYAVDNCGADWNEQAAKTAKAYMNSSSFSKSGLIEQLEFEGFTKEQAQYGATAVGY